MVFTPFDILCSHKLHLPNLNGVKASPAPDGAKLGGPLTFLTFKEVSKTPAARNFYRRGHAESRKKGKNFSERD
jgi:hypothetical protein